MFNLKDLAKQAFLDMEHSDLVDQMADDMVARVQQRRLSVDIPENFMFDMYWMGRRVGGLVFHDGFWTFESAKALKVALSEGQDGLEDSNVPYFVESLMPESWTSFSAQASIDDVFDPNCGDRYLSNIVIRPSQRKNPIVVDTLDARLAGHIDSRHAFMGRMGSCFIPNEEEKRRSSLVAFGRHSAYAAMINDIHAPKMSGVQDKLPAYLSPSGELLDVPGRSFTHILKFPQSFKGTSSTMGSTEWFSLMLAKKASMPVEAFAIASIDGFGPVLVVERFDVKTPLREEAILAEDMCSVLSLRRSDKANADMNDVMKAVLRVSSCAEEDARKLMRQVIFSWMIGNDDLHLKNMSLLKTYDQDMQSVKSIRLSPIYDIMTTRAYVSNDVPALSIAGRYDYDLDLFCKLGAVAGISANEVSDMTRELAESILESIPNVMEDLPDIIQTHPESMRHLIETCDWIAAPGSRVNTLLDAVRERRRARPSFS